MEEPSEPRTLPKSDAWSDLALTLPIFVGYHLGVVFLPIRNAADLVTRELATLANQSLLAYAGLTLAIGVAFVAVLLAIGRAQEFRIERFLWIAAEGVLYALAMRLVASYVVGQLPLSSGLAETPSAFAGLVMSLGAGFYEEVAFRVVLFGLGAKLIRIFAEPIPFAQVRLMTAVWAVLTALAFSGWHYLGELGDPFELRSFVFRAVCGVAFTVIYAFRGFAPVVWTHVIYDVWVLVF